VLWLGPPGVGTTPLAMGLGINALQAGLRTSLVRGPDRIALIGHEAPRGQWRTRLQPLCKPTRLIVDARGSLPLARPLATCLLPLVAQRDEHGAMILRRTKALRAWGELCTEQVLATALRDRLLHHSTILTIRGQSDRLQETRQAGVFPRPETLEAAPAPS
jgi:DNA replication protein DnaC